CATSRSKRSTSRNEKMSPSCGMSARISTKPARRATAATGIRARARSSTENSDGGSRNSARARRRSDEDPHMRSGSRYLSAVAAIVIAIAVGGNRRAAAQPSQAPASGRPLMVEDVFTNVQAFRGIGVDDFMLTMGIMSAAVGSDCVGCHPSAGTDHVDWALDTPRKRTARRMVQMVAALNRDNFNGRQVVTCWTCHRGRDRPVTTPTLDTVYGEPSLEFDDVLTTAPGVASVDQVLNKYLQAICLTATVAT